MGLVRDMQLLLEDTRECAVVAADGVNRLAEPLPAPVLFLCRAVFYNEEARQEAHGSLRQFRDFVLQGDLLTGAKLLDASHAQDIAQVSKPTSIRGRDD